MAVLALIPGAPVAPPAQAAAPSATGPSCSIQRSGSLWQLGIEAQELTTAIGQLAERLETDDEDSRSQALAEREAALLAEEGNKAALAAKADATCWVIESCAARPPTGSSRPSGSRSCPPPMPWEWVQPSPSAAS